MQAFWDWGLGCGPPPCGTKKGNFHKPRGNTLDKRGSLQTVADGSYGMLTHYDCYRRDMPPNLKSLQPQNGPCLRSLLYRVSQQLLPWFEDPGFRSTMSG